MKITWNIDPNQNLEELHHKFNNLPGFEKFIKDIEDDIDKIWILNHNTENISNNSQKI